MWSLRTLSNSNERLSLDVSSFGFGLRNSGLQTQFTNCSDRRSRNTQRNERTALDIEETFLLQIGVKRALGAALRVGNVVSYHYFLTSELTYAAHSVAFFGWQRNERKSSHPTVCRNYIAFILRFE